MTRPKIPKKVPEERPEKINPGIPVVPKKEPNTPEEPRVPRPTEPEKVPAYMLYGIIPPDRALGTDYGRCRRQVCYY